MYKGITLSGIEKFSSSINYADIENAVEKYKKKRKVDFDSLSSLFLHEDILDAKKIADHLFPDIEADIFLSHSHADEESAIILAVVLELLFGLKVFVDSCVWAHANDLLRGIDDEYCAWDDQSGYSYQKRNYSTAHVHMILNSALHSMIDRSELFIFLDTDNSAPLRGYMDGDKTYSPWIFSELFFSSRVEKKTPDRYSVAGMEKYALDEAFESEKTFAKSLNIAHPIYADHLPLIDTPELINILEYCSERKLTGARVLDRLYSQLLQCN